MEISDLVREGYILEMADIREKMHNYENPKSELEHQMYQMYSHTYKHVIDYSPLNITDAEVMDYLVELRR